MLAEIEDTLEALRDQLETLAVRGLRAAGSEHLAQLRAAHQELERIGAAHLAERIAAIVRGIEQADRSAARALLSALTSLRLFDRIVTLDVAREALTAFSSNDAPPSGPSGLEGDNR